MPDDQDILNNQSILRLKQAEEMKDKLRAGIAQQLIATKKFSAMSKSELGVCIRHIVGESNSEVELRNRLAELGLEYFDVVWHDVDPGDKTALEGQLLVKALGGLVAKNGATVSLVTVEEVY